MKKNSIKNCKIEWRKDFGNWNFRDRLKPVVLTKPLAIVSIDGDEFVWEHQDIIDLIDAYDEVDREAIDLIRKGEAGDVVYAEKTLFQKIRDYMKEKENKINGIKNHPYLKNGQKALI